jgi:hypothetical protein
MDVQYSPETRQSADVLKLLEQASARLADVVGPPSSQLVKADWTRVQDRQGRTVYRLTIRDGTDEVSTDFDVDELQNSLHMRFRLPRLWGDLLKIRGDRQHEQVQMLIDQMTSGVE